MEAPVVYLSKNPMYISRARASAKRLLAVSVERFNSLGNSGNRVQIATETAKCICHVPLPLLNKWRAFWRGCHSHVFIPLPAAGLS